MNEHLQLCFFTKLVNGSEAVIRMCFVKQVFLKFCKTHRKAPVPEPLLLIKLQASGCNGYRTPPVAASEGKKSSTIFAKNLHGLHGF